MHSSHGTLSPGLLWAEESGHVWGSGGALSLSAAPGHPPSLHPACATAAAEPSALAPPSTGVAAPAHWDDKGAQPGARVGTAPGLLAILLGMGGVLVPGGVTRGGSRAAPASGSERSSFWQGLPQGSQPHP